MSNPRLDICVAMPTYNGEAFVAEQLESIAAQTRPPASVVVSDDASKDGTLAVVERFRANAPFPIVISRNDSGLGCNGNFERAIRLCDGDVIALSDQDDVWLADHLETLVTPMEADPAVGLTIANSTYVDEQLSPLGTDLWHASGFTAADATRIAAGPQFEQWIRHHVVAGHALAFRADLRSVVLPFEPNWLYDKWLAQVCAACTKIALTDKPVALHRHHSSQTVGHRHMSLADRARQQKAVDPAYFASHVAALTAMRDRLKSATVVESAGDVMRALDERIALFDGRRRMRQGGAARRVSLAVAQLLRGRYHRYARGWLTFARDVRG